MEPITCIDLPAWVFKKMVDDGAVKIGVGQEPNKKVVTLQHQEINVNGTKVHLAMTRDEETALTINPGWLPGQRQRINNLRKRTR